MLEPINTIPPATVGLANSRAAGWPVVAFGTVQLHDLPAIHTDKLTGLHAGSGLTCLDHSTFPRELRYAGQYASIRCRREAPGR